MKNNILLVIGGILLLFGFFGNNLPSINFMRPTTVSVENYVIDAPSDDILLKDATKIYTLLKDSDDSTRPRDCLKLSALYCDMATLIALDGDDNVISDTASIRQANSLAGKMLRLNIQDKYPGLADSAKNLLTNAIGDEDVVLDKELRTKSVNAFMALSWAFYEGSK